MTGSDTPGGLGRIGWLLIGLSILAIAGSLGIAWFHDEVGRRRADIESALGRATGLTVVLGDVVSDWEGAFPGARARKVSLTAPGTGREVLSLDGLRVSLSLRALVMGRLELRRVELDRPRVLLERIENGDLRIGGHFVIPVTDEWPVLDWLLDRRRASVRGGTIVWHDRISDESFTLRNVEITLSTNWFRHRLNAKAELPAGMGRDFSVQAAFHGNPLTQDDSSGTVHLGVTALDVARLPTMARDALPRGLGAHLDFKGEADWEAGGIQSVSGRFDARALSLPAASLSEPLQFPELRAGVRYRRDGADWSFKASNLAVRLAAPSAGFEVGTLLVEQLGGRTHLSASRIDLAQLTSLAAQLRARVGADAPSIAPLERVLRMGSRGLVTGLKLAFDGELSALSGTPSGLEISGAVEGLSLHADGDIPGVRSLTGELRLGASGGSAELAVDHGEVHLPHVFRWPLPVRRGRAHLKWRRVPTGWEIRAPNVEVASEDGTAEADVEVTVPDSADVPVKVRVGAKVVDANGDHVRRYLPHELLDAGMLAWADRAFQGGRVTEARVVYDGHARDFPFDQGRGTFRVVGHVRDGIYEYLEGWAPIRDVECDVLVEGSSFSVQGAGMIGGLKSSDVSVLSRFDVDEGAVRVKGVLAGPAAETLSILRGIRQPDPQTAEWLAYLPEGLEGSGNGRLALDLSVPFDDRPLKIAGVYRFERAGISLPAWHVAAERLDGEIQFTELGARVGAIKGQAFGGPVTIQIAPAVSSQAGVGTQVRIDGSAQAPMVAKALVGSVGSRATGRVPYRASFREDRGAWSIAGDAELGNFNLNLPKPFDQWPARRASSGGMNPPAAPGEALRAAPPSGLRLATVARTPGTHVLSAQMDGGVDGRLRFAHGVRGWEFAGGTLAVGHLRRLPPFVGGRSGLSAEDGLWMTVAADVFDLDGWLRLARAEEDGVALPRRLSLAAGDLRAFGRSVGPMDATLNWTPRGLSGTVAGRAANGVIEMTGAGAERRLRLDFDRIAWPARNGEGVAQDASTSQGMDVSPADLPALSLTARNLRVGAIDLGSLEVSARPVPGAWQLDRMRISSPDGQIDLRGPWRHGPAGDVTQAEFSLESPDLGKLLTRLGRPDHVAGVKLSVKGSLSWPGPPHAIDWEALSGAVDVTGEKGTLLHVDPGVGRLVGFFDLSRLGKTLAADFNPVFGKGHSFDTLSGHFRIHEGVAVTDGLIVQGSLARIWVAGSVGLADERFDLSVGVEPRVGGFITVAGAGLGGALAGMSVGGPVGGVAAFALQNIFRKDIESASRASYLVRGPWSDPSVTRLAVPATEAGEKPPEIPQ